MKLLLAIVLASTGCALGEDDATNDDTYVEFQELENSDALAELRTVSDDAVVGVLRWETGVEQGTLSFIGDQATELSLQGVERNNLDAIEEAILEMYQVHTAPMNEEAELDTIASPLHDPDGVVFGITRTDGGKGGTKCVKQNVTYRASGYSYDPDARSRSIWVHFYAIQNGRGTYIGATLANRASPRENSWFNLKGGHRYVFTIPEAWDGDLNGAAFLNLRGFSINVGAGANKKLRTSSGKDIAYGRHGWLCT